MAHHAHPSDQGLPALGPRQQALLSEPLPICPLGSGGLGLTKVLLQGFKPLFHTFEIHGLCHSCQQSEPLAHG